MSTERFGGMTDEEMTAEIVRLLSTRSWKIATGPMVTDRTVNVCYVSGLSAVRDYREIWTVWMLSKHLDGEFSLIGSRDDGPWKQSRATQEQLSVLWERVVRGPTR